MTPTVRSSAYSAYVLSTILERHCIDTRELEERVVRRVSPAKLTLEPMYGDGGSECASNLVYLGLFCSDLPTRSEPYNRMRSILAAENLVNMCLKM